MQLIPSMKGPLFLALQLVWFVVTFPLRLVLGRITTVKQWLQHLKKEHIAASPKELWSYVDKTSRCIACGLCDVVAKPNESPSQWIFSAIRYPQDAVEALPYAQRLRELGPAINAICPTGVQVEQVVRLIEENAKELKALEM